MPVAAAKPAIASEKTTDIFDSPGKRNLILCLFLVVATLALYNPVSHNDFVHFDDDRYVFENSHVRSGLHWGTISWAFTSFEQANWHPLTWLSHALDCQLFSLNPAGHHYLNLLLHVVNVVLLFLILQWFTGHAGRSLAVAALFALHPINVESVAWVAERKNVLCMLFFLLAVAAYGWYVRKPGIDRYLLVTVLFALGLMSKPMVITLPLVLLLLDYWPLGRMRFSASVESHEAGDGGRFVSGTRSVWWLCLEKVPLLLLSVASAIVTMMAQKGGGAVVSTATHSLLLRLENAIVCYVRYVGKTVWPSDLAALYPYPNGLPLWQVGSSALFLLIVTGAVLKYREHRYLPVGWFWFLGTMVPMIGLVQVGNQAMADRYAYLPLIGLFIMIVWGAAEWVDARALPRKYLAATGVVAIAALAVVTHAQISYWHDDFKLWSRALAVTQNNFVAENNFVNALIRQGRADDAIEHFRKAAAIEPADAASQLNLGIYAHEHGDLKQAAAQYELVLRLATDTQLRASAYANLGSVYFALHDYPQARENFESALKLHRGFPVALLDLGLIAQKSGDWNHAIEYYMQFAVAAPSDVAYLLLAQALDRAGRSEEAQFARDQARRLSADLARAQQSVSQVLAQ